MTDVIIRCCIEFIVGYIVVFLLLYFFYYKKNKKNKKGLIEVQYLKARFRLKDKDLNISKMLIPIVLMDTFIIVFTWVFINLLPVNFFWQLLVSFALVIALIYSVYELYGRHIVNKLERRKE